MPLKIYIRGREVRAVGLSVTLVSSAALFYFMARAFIWLSQMHAMAVATA